MTTAYAVEYLYEASLEHRDDDAGDTDEGPGYYALIRGPLVDPSDHIDGLDEDELAELREAAGCIVHVDSQGSKDAIIYDTPEALGDAWDIVLNIINEYEEG